MRARSLFYVRAARAPGITMKELAGRLGLALQAVSIFVRHGEELVKNLGIGEYIFIFTEKPYGRNHRKTTQIWNNSYQYTNARNPLSCKGLFDLHLKR